MHYLNIIRDSVHYREKTAVVEPCGDTLLASVTEYDSFTWEQLLLWGARRIKGVVRTLR